MTQVRYAVVRTNGWAAWVIRAATRSSVNHAFVVDATGVTIEAQPGGMRYGKLSSYPDAILSDPIDGNQASVVWSWSLGHIGVGYGWVDLVAIALQLSRIPTPKWAIHRLISTDTLICSQAVCEAYKATGIDLGTKPAGLTTPADLLDLLKHEPEPADY